MRERTIGTETGMRDGGQKVHEGRTTSALESRTAKIPSSVFLWAAGASILASLGLQLYKRREESNFVGQWAPTFLILGLYNKIVKQLGPG